MHLGARCPHCGQKHTYFSHQVGAEAKCWSCGQRLELRPQPAVERTTIVAALVGALLIGGVMLLWYATRNHQGTHERPPMVMG